MVMPQLVICARVVLFIFSSSSCGSAIIVTPTIIIAISKETVLLKQQLQIKIFSSIDLVVFFWKK